MEQKKIERVLRELESLNLVSFDFLNNATLASLRQRLLDFEYHIVHFMGHGGVDPSPRESFDLLEDELGMSQNVTASQLQHMFRDVPST